MILPLRCSWFRSRRGFLSACSATPAAVPVLIV
ncbi:MAG: twin-arginine translocation signal domain-containing protein [Spirochaetales bacterium]|nr:twin-arginine translocation signal domain-containing protein [Spirochaetales bacterium]